MITLVSMTLTGTRVMSLRVRVGMAVDAMWLVATRLSHIFECNQRIFLHITVKIALDFASCNCVLSWYNIISLLHLNACD